MIHSQSTYNHLLENFSYANDAARTGATGFVTADIGKIAYQADTRQYWRLVATTPIWDLLTTIGSNASIAAVAAAYAADTYLAGSSIVIPAGLWRAKQIYTCRFDMVKTAAGTAAFTITVRMGTLGTTSDAAVLVLAFAVGTAAIDTGIFDLSVVFRTIGSGTSAVIQGIIACDHHLAATGLITTGASGKGIVLGTSSGFNSTTQTTIGLSINGGASFSGTNTLVQSGLI